MRVAFWQLVQGFLAKDLIFIDESGVNLALTRLYARTSKGKRAQGTRPKKCDQNVSLISALGLNGVLAQVSLMGATDSLTFEAFIARKRVPKLWPGACVILDNCSIHKRDEIEPWMTQAGAQVNLSPPTRQISCPLKIVVPRLNRYSVRLEPGHILI